MTDDSINLSAMAFPKESWIRPGKKKQEKAKRPAKKRKKHRKSIMQDKRDKRCYLCMLLNEDYREHTCTEEHHVIFGNGYRALSEEYGLKVNLCLKHHREGPEAVHNNHKNAELLMREAQERFQDEYRDLDWMQIFGKNYL